MFVLTLYSKQKVWLEFDSIKHKTACYKIKLL